ncbi:MAG: DEAD/DEAH box helicase, partial [Anaerolineales bacterium]|nr:DEAD/DEAH box helicase [Anaerolineales bacterium]
MNKEGIMESPFWPEPVEVLSKINYPEGFVTIEAIGLHTDLHYTTTIPFAEWKTLQSPKKRSFNFRGSAQEFKLALEAERLRLAYSADPLLAANNAKVHLLPHQMEAVYGAMLPQPKIRHLMAHDAGAGKTVMCGLLYKELLSRTPELRTLILTPAALTVQWQRELKEKFLVRFNIVERNELKANSQIWTESSSVITSVTFARQSDVQASLSSVKWDLVIVDEAHHLAGYGNRETLAYRLGQTLSRQSHHLVLATATPHKGDPVNFLKLLQLLDQGIDDPSVVGEKGPGQRGTPLMLRRLKEEMVDFNGQPLFKPRVVETRWHIIAENPPEMELYTTLTNYVNKIYRAAERLGGRIKVNTEFAMVMLQRRMGSSFAALEESLKRRQINLLQANETSFTEVDFDTLNELPEAERWDQEQRSELATPARTKQEREKEASEIGFLLEKLDAIRDSGVETKVLALKRILDDSNITPRNGEKLLVFTEFKDTLDFLRKLFEGWGFTVTQIDGSMSHDRRRKAEKEFSQSIQIMLATEAAGEGINLQFCAYMVNYDLPWIPSRLEQRMGRIHRYGQKRVVHIYNLTAGDTREGTVLLGLLNRLDEMRQHLGDQVFDVVSTLVSEIDLERLLARVATSPSTEASQDQALHELIQATMAGEERYRQWEEHPFAISPDEFRQMQEASRQSRLTPEYAQHFFVDVLTELKEEPKTSVNVLESPGDADVFQVELLRTNVARELELPHSKLLNFSFRPDRTKENGEVQFVALGTELFDRMLQLAQTRWGKRLSQGAIFM